MIGESAACASLPFDRAVELFYPPGDGGLVKRTSRWPQADSHVDARRVCGGCPVLGECLTEALNQDAYTFRALSVEERAAVGGTRQKASRGRRPYLTVSEVLRRVVDAGYDIDEVMQVLIGRDHQLTGAEDMSGDPGVWLDSVGWADGLPESGWDDEAVLTLIEDRWGGVERRKRRSPRKPTDP